MRILVTGAGGMLGSDLVGAAVLAGVPCAAMTHAELNIADETRVQDTIAAAAPTVVVNCAAWTDVDGAESAVQAALAVNGDGAGNVARAAARLGAWTIHISSDYVFEGTKHSPYFESDATAPLSAYGRSKVAGERAVAREAPSSHTIVRSSWLFGIHGRCFPATILRLARDRDELTVVDDQVGCPTYTGHLAQALVTLCQTRPLGVVHVAGGGSCSWYDLAAEVVARGGLPTRVKPGRTADQGRPAPRPPYSVLGTERPTDAPRLPHWREGLDAYMGAAAASRPPVRALATGRGAPGASR